MSSCELRAQLLGLPWPHSPRQWFLAKALAMAEMPELYWVLGALLGTLALLSACWAAARFRPDRAGVWLGARGDGLRDSPGAHAWQAVAASDSIFLGVALAFVVFWRWPGLGLGQLNVDEDQALWGLARYVIDPVHWRSFDGTTSGPLNTYVPYVALSLLRLAPDYAGLRLVGLCCTLASLAFQYGALRRLFGAAVARIALLPVLIGTAFMVEPDYVHYSSELVSVLLLSGACYGIVVMWCRQVAGKAVLAVAVGTGLALGALPYAKLQSAPIGLFLGTVTLGWWVYRIRRRDLSARLAFAGLALGALACSLLVALGVTALGLWPEFWCRYVLGNVLYGSEIFPWRLYRVLEDIVWMPTNLLLIKMLLAAALVPGLVCIVALRRLPARAWGWLAFALAFLAVALFCVLKPGTNWPHYFLFLHAPAALLLALLLASAARVRDAGSSRLLPALTTAPWVLSAAVVLLAGAALRSKLRDPVSLLPAVRCAPCVLSSPLARQVLRVSQPGDRLAVWGYMPEVSYWSGVGPAVRDYQTYFAMLHPRRGYYCDAFLADLRSAMPEVFVDAVAPTSKYLKDCARYAHERFPEVAEHIKDHYRPVADCDGLRAFLRADLAQARSAHGK